MNRQKWILLVATVGLMAGTAWALNWFKGHQRLGEPGIKGVPKDNGVVWKIDLPERVLDFSSEQLPEDSTVTNMLPKDTSFAQRLYRETNGFWASANIILMGMDRTSIHKPEFCLPGSGFRIDKKTIVDLSIGGPSPYTLPVAKWSLSRFVQAPNGSKVEQRALYVFWFVANDEHTVSHWQRLWWLTRDLVRTGVLQRWAYVSYYTAFPPGQEDAAFDQLKRLIVASVPEFQRPPRNTMLTSAAN
jgi:hypothetical protein